MLLSARTPAAAAQRAKRISVVPRAAFSFPNLLNVFQDKTAKRALAKEQLLDLLPSLNRGLEASEETRDTVEAAASALEALNPTPKPLASPLINGQWKLLYTTSQGILGGSKPAPFRPSGPILQILDAETLTARNQETAPFFNSVYAELVPQSASKVAVQFKTFKIFNLLPVTAPDSARGELDVTYLDEDLRISRGDKGNLFILEMDDPDVRP